MKTTPTNSIVAFNIPKLTFTKTRDIIPTRTSPVTDTIKARIAIVNFFLLACLYLLQILLLEKIEKMQKQKEYAMDLED